MSNSVSRSRELLPALSQETIKSFGKYYPGYEAYPESGVMEHKAQRSLEFAQTTCKPPERDQPPRFPRHSNQLSRISVTGTPSTPQTLQTPHTPSRTQLQPQPQRHPGCLQAKFLSPAASSCCQTTGRISTDHENPEFDGIDNPHPAHELSHDVSKYLVCLTSGIAHSAIARSQQERESFTIEATGLARQDDVLYE